MAAARPNPRLAKIHRSYTVDEIAKLYGVHRNTVRAWIARGLPTVDQRRPWLVLGAHLSEFLQARRTAAKRTCRPGEIYCLRCREPRNPAGGAVRYRPITATLGSLEGVCGCCGAGLNRKASLAKLRQVLGELAVTMALDHEHIGDSQEPSLNCDFKEDERHHAETSP